jgi:ParB family chromosome partitioning protein
MGHARALLALEGAAQVTAAQEVIAKRLSVREAEKLVARAAIVPKGRQAPLLRVKNGPHADTARLERLLADALAAPVEIRVKKRTKRGDQGELVIGFASLDELSAVLQRLGIDPES